ncbi:MAG: DnaJ family domain-containing protein [Dissulfurimicrobium sp.]|uniref:DnaJ family domain-containing protein n=1 Tax=Dissulfurimicrobium sp. TaxID=2022436 RepID=UPI003D0A7F58
MEQMAEKRIREAMERGDFDNIKGKGRPLVYEDDSFVPPDLRMAYKILKNAGFLPPELQEGKEIRTAIDLLNGLTDEEERYRQVRKLNIMITKINLARKRPVNLEVNQLYYRKVAEKVRVYKNTKGAG